MTHKAMIIITIFLFFFIFSPALMENLMDLTLLVNSCVVPPVLLTFSIGCFKFFLEERVDEKIILGNFRLYSVRFDIDNSARNFSALKQN